MHDCPRCNYGPVVIQIGWAWDAEQLETVCAGRKEMADIQIVKCSIVTCHHCGYEIAGADLGTDFLEDPQLVPLSQVEAFSRAYESRKDQEHLKDQQHPKNEPGE